MAKMTIDGNTIKIANMNVAGGGLPGDWSIKLNVDIDCTGASTADLLKAVGSRGARIPLQAILRAMGTDKLTALKKAGTYKTTFASCMASPTVSPVKPEDALMALSQEDFITWCKDHMGISDKQALVIYNRKHGIVVK
jgi:hypothetical protein